MILTANELAEVVDWSRAQFAMTAIYHWLFVPLTLGLGFICAIMETVYYRTGDPFWKRTVKFWMRIFGINFAIGVATGLILEFEFGTNWSNYSYFVGDIFGAPLAIEGIMAFFLESTFIAVMFFGWNKVSRGFHLTATWLTAIGANLSALWILVANAWMQYPVGTAFNPETARQEMTSFWDVLFSPVAINKFFHTVTSGYVVAAAVVIGISAWFLLKKRERKMARKSMAIASWFGLSASLLLAMTGDGSAVQVARTQPMKLAAMEALYDGKKEAGLVAFGILRPEVNNRELIMSNESAFYFKLEIPKMLSLLSFRDADAYVPGINDLVYGNFDPLITPVGVKMEAGREAVRGIEEYGEVMAGGDEVAKARYKARFDPQTEEGARFCSWELKYLGYAYLKNQTDVIPNVPLVFYSFRVMFMLGVYFILFFAGVLFFVYRKELYDRRWWFRVMMWSVPLAYLASVSGWIVAEVGRQPWTIQDLLPVSASVSDIAPGPVKATFFIFLALFTVLLIAELMIMFRQIKIGPKPAETAETAAENELTE
nr:cytochrome ubiquinol oxidase subunit I [uncultured Alistipes sp.]